MQVTNNPADIVTDKEMEYLKDTNERLARQFVTIIAEEEARRAHFPNVPSISPSSAR